MNECKRCHAKGVETVICIGRVRFLGRDNLSALVTTDRCAPSTLTPTAEFIKDLADKVTKLTRSSLHCTLYLKNFPL